MTLARVISLRLPAEQAHEAELTARIEGTSLSEFIRDALAAHLASRRTDPQLREILKRLEDYRAAR